MIQISIVTPTYNRTRFLRHLCSLILGQQDFDLQTVEWVIIDDSVDDCSKQAHAARADEDSEYLSQKIDGRLGKLTYIRLVNKNNVGTKRNIGKGAACGDIILHCDDDDYYGPHYVRDMVEAVECARRSGGGGAGAGVVVGASAIYFMYPSDPFLYQSGPFHANHTCAGIMAYTKEYAQTHHFDTTQNRAEERLFLREYRQKVVQIDASYRIYMPLAHDTNTVDKSRLQRRKTDLVWFNYVVTKEATQFYFETYPLHLPFARGVIGFRENDGELS